MAETDDAALEVISVCTKKNTQNLTTELTLVSANDKTDNWFFSIQQLFSNNPEGAIQVSCFVDAGLK
jgi:hypothetical protein